MLVAIYVGISIYNVDNYITNKYYMSKSVQKDETYLRCKRALAHVCAPMYERLFTDVHLGNQWVPTIKPRRVMWQFEREMDADRKHIKHNLHKRTVRRIIGSHWIRMNGKRINRKTGNTK